MAHAPNQQLPAHVDTLEALDISSREHRLRWLQRLSLKAERVGDLRLAAQILDQAARELRAGAGGGEGADDDGLPKLTPAQARLELEEFLMRYEEMRERGERTESQAGLPGPFWARDDGIGAR